MYKYQGDANVRCMGSKQIPSTINYIEWDAHDISQLFGEVFPHYHVTKMC